MDYRTLGRTGLRVSVMGWGAGGPSRLGQRDEVNSEADSVALVQRGLDAGINFIDTAEAYRTEEIVGKAIAGRERDSHERLYSVAAGEEKPFSDAPEYLEPFFF